jgi:hypothetical protein
MSYRSLDAAEIVKTIRALEARILARFPTSGLSKVCHELLVIAEDTQRDAQAIARPNLLLRSASYLAGAFGVIGICVVILVVTQSIQLQVGNEVFGVFQGIDAAMNITVLAGAALFFTVTLEDRLKRRQALSGLHVFRTISHVIDMHQLTKDPSAILARDEQTPASPKRSMSRFQLTRYLDYCSEMQALTGKLAALYAQNLPDTVVIEAVNDIEELTTNFSRKIWQKITILEAYDVGGPPRTDVPPAGLSRGDGGRDTGKQV